MEKRIMGNMLNAIAESYFHELMDKPEYKLTLSIQEGIKKKLLDGIPARFIELQQQVNDYESIKNLEASIIREFYLLKGIGIGIRLCCGNTDLELSEEVILKALNISKQEVVEQ